MSSDIPDYFLLICFAFFGACLGSFASAIIHREKEKISWFGLRRESGRSKCVHCQQVLSVKDLMPVLSWVWQRGLCRYCKKPLSFQYVALELGLAAVAALIFIVKGLTLQALFLLIVLPFITAQIVLFLRYKVISARLFSIIGVVIIIYGVTTFVEYT